MHVWVVETDFIYFWIGVVGEYSYHHAFTIMPLPQVDLKFISENFQALPHPPDLAG